jgi:isopenicillin-N N-acyltransferase-like protein
MSLRILDLPLDEPDLRGRIHGNAFRREIGRNVETSYRRFERNGLTRESARRQVAEWNEAVLAKDQSVVAELQAIATAAEIDYLHVALLNLRFEIGYALQAARVLHGPPLDVGIDGCTSFGLLGDAAADGHVKIGQTLDGIAAIGGNLAVFRDIGPHGATGLGLYEAGGIGPACGLNSNGIGAVYNSLICPSCEQPPFGPPFRLRMRAILRAGTFAGAIGAAISAPRPTAIHLLLADRGGELVGLELAQMNAAYLEPQCGLLTHANHFERMPAVVSLFEHLLPDSLFRGNRLRRLLLADGPKVEHRTIEAALRDHFSFPSSICLHGDHALPMDRRAMTLAGVIMDLNSATLFIADGPPCSADFVPIALTSGSSEPHDTIEAREKRIRRPVPWPS